MSVLPKLEAAFRAAADDLGGRDVERSTGAELRARLVLHQVRKGTRWLEEALRAVEAADLHGASEGSAPDRLFACCEGWVLRAVGPFRPAADARLAEIVDGPDAVPALLRYWRITGNRTVLERALAAVPESSSAGDATVGAACWAAFQATADDALLERARASIPRDPAQVAVKHWPVVAHVHGLEPDDFADAVDGWEAHPPAAEDVIPTCAMLALPPLVVDVQWWYQSDLFSGPVAEAATFPYPGVRLRFRRLPHSAQAVITPILAGEATDPLEDIGVIAALIDDVVSHVDRTALRDAPRRRRRPSRLLRR